MEPQQNPVPGWYPDPAGGPQRRYWDGMRWNLSTGPARPPVRSRRRIAVIVAVVLAVTVCVTVPVVFVVGSMLGPSLGELTDAVDEVTLPADFTFIEDTSWGTRICLDECVHLSRTYASPLPAEATIKIVVAALEKANYQCVIPPSSTVNRDWCGGLEAGVLSYWKKGTDGFTIDLVVYPIPGNWASMYFSDKSVDPAWQSYLSLGV